MPTFDLVEIVTKDNLVHQGIYHSPVHPGKKAILWVHGLTDNFYGDKKLLGEIAAGCEKNDWGLASFNTRGHDIVASVKKLDPTNPKGHTSLTIGSGYETFTDCVFDIGAGISFLAGQGFTQVILAGISTGANKVCYYAGKIKDSRVVGVVLISPISDVPIESKAREYQTTMKKMLHVVRLGKGDTLYDSVSYLALTPKRYISLYTPGSVEDVFDYYSAKPKFSIFSNIHKHLCIILAGSDEYADRPVKKIADVYKKFQKSRDFHISIIPGAFHGFGSKEMKLAAVLCSWVSKI